MELLICGLCLWLWASWQCHAGHRSDVTVVQLWPFYSCMSICPVRCGCIAGDGSCLFPLFPVGNTWQASRAGWISKKTPKEQLRGDAAKEGLRPSGDVIKLRNHLPCCWRCSSSSSAIVTLHSAGSHLVRPQQRQLVGLISPGHAVLHSNLCELLQTAAAGLKWDSILSTEGQEQNQCCPLTKSLLSTCHPGYCWCDGCPPRNFTSFFFFVKMAR